MLSVLRFIHIAAGSLALMSLSIPLFSRKGGKVHRQSGHIFVWSMGVLCAAALCLCAIRFADPARRTFTAFLAFNALLGWHSASSGRRVIVFRDEKGQHRALYDYILSVSFLLASLSLGVWGILRTNWLFVGFAIIGSGTSLGMLRYWLARTRNKGDYLVRHIGSMLAACITAITALFVVNAPRFYSGAPRLLVWLGPTALGVPVIIYWQRRYARRPAACPGIG